jgi:hypothetical protein
MILSFDRKEETEVAKQMAHEYLEKNFPNQKAIVSIHQDQDKSHVHIWFDCRDVDTDRKTQIQPKDFYALDEKWARQYDRKYGTEYEREYTTKKRETFEWKKEQYERTQGVEGKKERPEDKPARHTDNKAQIIKAREDKEHGMDKNSARTDERPTSIGRERIEQSERSFEQSKSEIIADAGSREDRNTKLRNSEQPVIRSEQEIDRSNSAIKDSDRSADDLSKSVGKLAERGIPARDLSGRDRSDDYSR